MTAAAPLLRFPVAARSESRWWRVAPPIVAFALALVTMALGWRGVDWPAQIYRVQLFRAHGWIGFDTGWYSGNAPIAYSTLFPPIAATIGIRLSALVCATGAAAAFDRIVRRRFGPAARWGSLCFAAGMVAQVAIGQLPFLLGMALGLTAVLALSAGRWGRASLLAFACALASFVAALFLAIAAVAWWMTSSRVTRRTRALLAGSAVVPIVVVGLAYHQTGVFPFPATTIAAVMIVCVGAWLVLPAEESTVRVGVLIYAGVSIAFFAVPTPVGANVARMATVLAVPLLVCAGRRRLALRAALVAFVVAWQLAPASGAIDVARRDPSTTRSYYAPLLAELTRIEPGVTRLEIPLTRQHWEAAWVAPRVALARGWERQLDIGRNPLFYESGRLTPGAYRSWLLENGVGWVALPNAPLDYSAGSEAALLRAGVPYLEVAWESPDWTLWRVSDSPGMVSGAGTLTALDAGSFTVNARASGDLVVKVRYSRTWSIVGPDSGSCLTSTGDSWTVVRARRRGPIRVGAGLLPSAASAC